ncbi:NUDIX domain-containing protein [Microbacterium sp.]|uniref:NUDIX domain-containing protein n=1 Tax=Microbacterium sp. TaxID=51671 RepID=UPI00263097AE|nr:NUDIX domain-containing protein [Microbacterium sp.]
MVGNLPVAGTAIVARDAADGFDVLLIRRPDRGSFAGAWVFPGGMVEPADVRPGASEIDTAARAAVRETSEEVALITAGLTVLSQWTPPPEAPKRVRTWFFLCSDMRGTVTPAPDEVADWQWVRPIDALAQHARGEIELFPPTWVTLHLLAGMERIADAVAAASDPEHFQTHMLQRAGSRTFVWAGDREHPTGGTGTHRLETATRPWTYVRTAAQALR